MFVLTIDQEKSRSRGDRVPALLEASKSWTLRSAGIELPFERTVGDEVQAVASSPDVVLRMALETVRLGGWYVGIGIGAVDLPLPEHSREASGPAFVSARAAVERAKRRPGAASVAVEGASRTAAVEAEAIIRLLSMIVQRRSSAGWEVVDRLRAAGERSDQGPRSQQDVASDLGISAQAVSQRLRAASWSEEQAALPLAARLLSAAGSDDAVRSSSASAGSD